MCGTFYVPRLSGRKPTVEYATNSFINYIVGKIGMGEISIIELGVYAFVTYSTLLMLIISVIKEAPQGKSLAIARSIYVIPGIICAGILAGSGINIVTDTVTTANTIKNLNSSEVWTETTTQSKFIALQSEVWILIHWMIFLVLVAYVLMQVLILLTKHEKL